MQVLTFYVFMKCLSLLTISRALQSLSQSPAPRQLKFGAILTGVGTAQNEWLHPQIPDDASVDVDIAWYRAQAQQAEAAKVVRRFLGWCRLRPLLP